MNRRRKAASWLEGLDAQRTAIPGEDNFGWVDRYTAGHAAAGVLYGLARLPWWAALGAQLFWDLILERVMKDAWPEIFPNSTQDTWKNIAGDTVAAMAGWGFVWLLPYGTVPNDTTLP